MPKSHYMLCRHAVADFEAWKQIFDSHAEAQREAGLEILHVLRDHADPNHVTMLFRVADLDMARAFTDAPEAKEAGDASGVLGVPELILLHD